MGWTDQRKKLRGDSAETTKRASKHKSSDESSAKHGWPQQMHWSHSPVESSGTSTPTCDRCDMGMKVCIYLVSHPVAVSDVYQLMVHRQTRC